MSISQFLHILMSRWRLVLAIALLLPAVALAIASRLPKQYPASARVMFELIRPDPITGSTVQGQAQRGYISTQIELLKDYRVAGDVVDRLGWLQDPAVIARWKAETGGEGDMRRWGAQQIIANTQAAMVKQSNLLDITYTAPNPAVARKTVAYVRDAFIEGSLRYRTDSAGRTGDWYAQQTDKARAALVAAESAVSKFTRDNNLVVTGGTEAETARLQALQAELANLRTAATQQGMSAQIVAVPQPVDQLSMQLSQIEDQLEQAKQTLGTQHPTYKALVQRRELAAQQLQRQIQQNNAQKSSTGSAYETGIAKVQAEYNAQKQKVLEMQPILNQLAQLQREVLLRQTQYDSAAAKSAALKFEANAAESGIVPIGEAIGSTTPAFPNMPLIGGAALAVGLGLGLLTALIAEMLQRRVRGREDLAHAARAPVLAVISSPRPGRPGGAIRRIFGRTGTASSSQWQPAE